MNVLIFELWNHSKACWLSFVMVVQYFQLAALVQQFTLYCSKDDLHTCVVFFICNTSHVLPICSSTQLRIAIEDRNKVELQ